MVSRWLRTFQESQPAKIKHRGRKENQLFPISLLKDFRYHLANFLTILLTQIGQQPLPKSLSRRRGHLLLAYASGSNSTEEHSCLPGSWYWHRAETFVIRTIKNHPGQKAQRAPVESNGRMSWLTYSKSNMVLDRQHLMLSEFIFWFFVTVIITVLHLSIS